MAKNLKCSDCGQELVNGVCVNDDCVQEIPSAYGSLIPEDFTSLDPTQIVDFTGTIGVSPSDGDPDFAQNSIDADADSAQTRMVDDDFYRQIQTFFPAGSGSGSSSASGLSDDVRNRDQSQSLSVRGVRDSLSIEEFVPPVRDIRFPSDTASLEDIKKQDSESLEGEEYRISDKLGEGGYGIVFEANQTALNRPVAVKVLKPKRKKPGSKAPSRTGTGTGELQRRRDQFLHEAKITARLQHPNIVPLYDFGINTQGQLFYSMKKVEDRSWATIITKPEKLLDIPESELDEASDRLAISKNVEIFDRVCDAMAYTHAQKIIHRDLKPDNIMIGAYGEVLLIDFGMALDFSEGNPEFSAGGTLVYMAPEMAAHFAKQKEIQVAAQKTAQALGVEEGSIFLDQSNLIGIGQLASRLIKESKDQGVQELAESLMRLDSEEKELAEKISYGSDIYLLGAILYQIAVGHPPHYFPVAACKKGRREKFQKELWLALKNGFQQYSKITDPLRISLRNIAVKAMAAEPKNRFRTVEDLQEAIRGFQLQVQSLEMTETGKEELEKAEGGEGYQHLLPALESFRGAGALWPEGNEATTLQVKTACEYAKRADDRKDFDAGLSILDEYVVGEQKTAKPVVALREKLVDGKRRQARNRKLAAFSGIAAVALPILVFAGFSWATKATFDKLQVVETQKIEAEKLTQVAVQKREEADEKTAEAVKKAEEADKKLAEADKKLITAGENLALAETKQKKAEEAEKALGTKVSNLEEKQRSLTEEVAEVQKEKEQAVKETLAAEMATQAAEALKKTAEAAAIESKQLADKFQFDADFGSYNSNVLTIPFDLRTGKLGEAASKLERLAESDAKEHFKNGWIVQHFRKRVKVDGISKKLGDDTSVRDVVVRPGTKNSIIVGTDSGKPAVWEMSPSGNVKKLAAELPAYGKIADLSVSADGKWIALALNDTMEKDVAKEHLWVLNLDSGVRAKLPKPEGVVGCSVVEFSPQGNQLVSVEELSGYRGLKQRVQVVTRTLSGDALSKGSVTPVSATTRDEGRVRHLATANWNTEGQATVGLAYQTLDESGQDVFQMETFSGSDSTMKSNGVIETSRFPTAIHVGGGGKLYVGHADGEVVRYDAQNPSVEPVRRNRNESEIVRFESSDDGRLVSGSENGALIVWDTEFNLDKRLDGQPEKLSALTFGEPDPDKGLTMVTADEGGNIRVWEPETSKHDAKIRKRSNSVTCGTVDQSLNAGAVPAAAYGTKSGQVYYYNSADMIGRGGGQVVNDVRLDADATFKIKSPFESFGIAFNDFDSMGIVDDHFVLMRDDGTFYSSYIDTRDSKSSARTQSKDLSNNQDVIGKFSPLLTSVRDKDYFFSTDPTNDGQLVYWQKSADNFSHQSLSLPSRAQGRVKRLSLSPDGNWLAVVRQVGRVRTTGEYVAEVYDVRGGVGGIRLAAETKKYRVGDPAFVGFSPDSQRMILHHQIQRIDRETWVEHWELAGNRWRESLPKQKLEDRKVDLVDWADGDSAAEALITKINRKYFLLNATQPVSYQRAEFKLESRSDREKLRSVRSTGNGDDFYVLSSNRLSLYTNTEPKKEATFASPIEDARDLRVFGDLAILLDKSGFHLVDSDLNYVTKLANRRVGVKSVSLSSGRLAVLYDNQFCQVFDVRGETPAELGKVENVESVRLSPDGKWAAISVDQNVSIYSVGSNFDQAKWEPGAGFAAFQWTGKPSSTLLTATEKDGTLDWKEFDPVGEKAVVRNDLPKTANGMTDFKLAPITENYIAIQDEDSISLWATGAEPVRMNKDDHEFDSEPLNDIESFGFSEISGFSKEETGTRFVVLASDGSEGASPDARIYLLAKEDPKAAVDGELAKAAKYRVIEIEGALEKEEGIDLIDAQFSGDGRSLLQVTEKGITTLLTK